MRSETRAWAGRLFVVVLGIVAVAAVNGDDDPRRAGLGTYYFQVTIDGQATGFFRSVSGLSVETDVVEYREGGANDIIRKLPGVTRYANIRLSRAFTGDRALYDWYAATIKPQPTKVDGQILMLDQQGTPIAKWTFVEGFPVKWEGPEFDASSNEVPIETIEIAHEGLTLSDDDK